MKAITNTVSNVLVALAIVASAVFVTVQGTQLVNSFIEDCTTTQSSEGMNKVTCSSGVHYVQR